MRALISSWLPVAASAALAVTASAALAIGCDKGSDGPPPAPPAPTGVSTPSPAQAPAPPALPEIIVDPANVTIGKDHVPAAPLGLTDRVATLLDPAWLGGSPENPDVRTMEVVDLRNDNPSQDDAVRHALRHAKASGATLKTEARDGTTQKLALSFASHVPDCAAVAWIAKDAAIDVWPAGGGVAKRVIRGLAGPDITLGLEAIESRSEACGSSSLVATSALGNRGRTAILVTNVTPGRRVDLK
jgi:hypothetical protein